MSIDHMVAVTLISASGPSTNSDMFSRSSSDGGNGTCLEVYKVLKT
jgi:hypothetical protein